MSLCPTKFEPHKPQGISYLKREREEEEREREIEKEREREGERGREIESGWGCQQAGRYMVRLGLREIEDRDKHTERDRKT
jgi:hypothetical protein